MLVAVADAIEFWLAKHDVKELAFLSFSKAGPGMLTRNLR